MRTRLAADATAPGEARAFVTAQLEATPLPHGVTVDDVVLVTSELVTNAVQAGGTTLEVELLASPQRIELVVTDDGPGWPARTDASETDTSGRGLRIVDHLAHIWDAVRRPQGKAVRVRWFDQERQRTQP